MPPKRHAPGDKSDKSSGKEVNKKQKTEATQGQTAENENEGESEQDEGYSNGNENGWVNGKRQKPRKQKMKWTADNDRILLLIGLGKEIAPKDFAAIIKAFKEGPTEKSIQERLSKLRDQQRKLLKKLGMWIEDGTDSDNGLTDIREDYRLPLARAVAGWTADDLEAAAAMMRANEQPSVLQALRAQEVARSTEQEEEEDKAADDAANEDLYD